MAMGLWLKIFGLQNEDANPQYDLRFAVPNFPILVR